MVELFHSYWWLIFPLAFFVLAAWDSFMKYQRHKANLELLKTYATSGKEPPENLVRAMERSSRSEFADINEADWGMGDGTRRSGGSTAFLVLLFLGLGGIFAYEGYSGFIGVGPEAYLVAAIMGVLAVAFLGSAIFGGRK